MSLPTARRAATATRPRGDAAWLVVAVLAGGPLAAFSVFRALPVEWPTRVVQLLAFTPWMLLPGLVGVLAALLSRRRWLVTVSGTLLAAQLFWLFPLDYGRDSTDSSAPVAELKVMNINSQMGRADAAEIVRLVRDNGIGLLTIQEHTQALEDRLDAEGLASLLPHRISHPADGAAGNALFSVRPLTQVGILTDSPFQMPTVRLSMEAGDRSAALDVTNVHTQAPVDGRIRQWRSDLEALGTLTGRPGNVLLIGDFNATYDQSEFRRVLAAGPDGRKSVDVATAVGSRLVPTWPMDGQALPGIVIDHIITSSQLRSAAYSVHPVAGSDHAAIMATLAVPTLSPCGSVCGWRPARPGGSRSGPG
jgi:endonuclease/exonuclease/phosphatase (EEP) superfamily protein YafD